jgi:hypothetical protein
MEIKKTEEKPRERPVRTPPNYLLEARRCTAAYRRDCSKYKLVLETDGFGVIPHN